MKITIHQWSKLKKLEREIKNNKSWKNTDALKEEFYKAIQKSIHGEKSKNGNK